MVYVPHFLDDVQVNDPLENSSVLAIITKYNS